jgi:hypothetical protein
MTPAIAEKTLAGGGISVARRPAGPAPEILRSPHASGSPETSEAAAVFQTRGLTKIYKMGEVEVPALRGIDLENVALVTDISDDPSADDRLAGAECDYDSSQCGFPARTRLAFVRG